MKILNKLILLLGFFLLLNSSLSAKTLDKKDVPEPLKPWVGWVMYDQDKQACASAYNGNFQFCAWPSSLQLDLNNKQGTFKQHWKVQIETWVTLPGNAQQWPHEVMVDGEAAIVVSRGNNMPSIKLDKGEHDIAGKFLWDSLPETLSIPPTTGLIKISRNGQSMDFPRINQQGQLWLDKSLQKKSVQDALDVQVYRKIDDGHPMQVHTRLILRVSGRSRDVSFSKLQLAGFTPLKLKSQLPARINQQGDLQIQIRPGNWQVDLVSYKSGIVSEIGLSVQGDNLPKQEVWVFKSNPSLRLTEISGVPAVDSRQTLLPKEWQSLPAYLLNTNQSMTLKTLQRGSASPEPNRLTLQRSMWMDFSGKGYTFRDKVKGTMTRDWRLVSSPELELGSARMDDEPQFITTLKNGEDTGIEVRRGQINLEAASRYTQSLSELPVSGWKHDFQQVNTTLFLAPGWKLFSAYGADNLPRTWLQSWTLLDLFLVLIIAISIARLWNWKWGVFAILTMVLIWHEPNSPKYIWLNLIAAIALLRVLPEGIIKKLIWGYRNIVLLALLLIIIPFTVSEVRNGLYPQLGLYSDYDSVQRSELPYDYQMNGMSNGVAMEEAEVVMPATIPGMSSVSKRRIVRQDKGLSKQAYMKRSKMNSANQMVDPNANIQTGPGLPTWNWKRVQFIWNSPVNQSQKLELTLISPTVNLILNFLRVILLLVLIARLLRTISFNNKSGNNGKFVGGLLGSIKSGIKLPKVFKGASAILLPLFVLMLLSPLSNVMAEGKKISSADHLRPSQPVQQENANYPSEILLKTLRQRLLVKTDCLPNCAQIEAMRLEIADKELRVFLQIHAADDVAVPLPGNAEQWRADQVLQDNQQSKSLYRDRSGVLWLGVKKGISHIVMQGRLPKQPQLQLSLPLAPKYVEWKGAGWTVEGIRENHIPAQQIQLVRKQQKNAKSSAADLSDNNYLPPLLHVERTLHLGLDWFIDTNVTRLSPVGTPLSMKIPLLKGESVLSNAYTVKKGKVLINMSSTQRRISWQSQIPVADHLSLVATQEKGLVESWKLDISPIWHVEISGIPEIHHGNQRTVWLPEWQPWPGEKVDLKISRPQGIAGRTLTIERSILSTKVGKRLRESELTLKMRSSRGGQHPIVLPENAKLISVYINGKLQPVRQQQRTVSLPIVPGKQSIVLKWRTDKPISSKVSMLPVNVGVDNVNNSMHLSLGRDRWILFANGPTMGPAVLFWGVLLVILLGSLILGRIKHSPLKSWQWFLLGAGLSLATPIMIVLVVGWLLALSYRPRLKVVESRWVFNGVQVLLVLLTLIALGSLFIALQQGLLGWPEMQIKGNASNAWQLRWYQDRSPVELPQPWVLSVPLFVYRVLMLLWALWLAFSLISWLKMGWQNLSEGGLWRAGVKRVKKVKAPAE